MKRKLFDSCVFSVLTYGAETFTLTNASANKLQVAPRAMERSMLRMNPRYKKTNEWIREQRRVVDVMKQIVSLMELGWTHC